MKRASLTGIVFFLICSGVSFGSAYSGVSSTQHQIHFSSKLSAQANSRKNAPTKLTSSISGSKAQQSAQGSRTLMTSERKPTSNLKVQRHANPSTGKARFVSATQIPVGGYETLGTGVIGDFNGDGKPDVMTPVAGFKSFSISIVLGNGDGTFKAPVLTALDDSCTAFAVGDLNGDKKDDILIVHNPGYDCPSLSSTFDVLISNGDGTFTQKNTTPYPIGPNLVSGGTLAVTTKSGFLNVVAVDSDGTASSVITILGNGDGTFSTGPTSVALSGPVSGTALMDLNGDGLLDVVGFDPSNEVTVFMATSATSYAPGVPYTTPNNYYYDAPVFGDLTNDGKPEIVIPNSTGSLAVYMNNGDGSFQPAVFFDAILQGHGVARSTTVAIADVNSDGNADVISSNASGDVTILLGNGDGTLNAPVFGFTLGGAVVGAPCSNCAWYPPAVIADFDGDGFLDIVVPDTEFGLAFLKGYNDGTFSASHSYYVPDPTGPGSGYGYTEGIASGDFDGDGIPDIVIAGGGDSNIAGITVFLSGGDGTLKPGIPYGTSNCYLYVVVADFDKDGQPDLAANNQCTGEVQTFIGKANGTFVPGPAASTGSSNIYSGGEMVVGDFDGDGYPDMAVINVADVSTGNSSVAVILNDGTGNFKPAKTYALSNYSFAGIAVGDLNGDGKLDLVVPYNLSSSLAVLLGVGDGTFTQPPDLALGTPRPDQCNGLYAGQFCPAAVALADVDGDGNMDIIATLDSGGGQDIVILPGTGTTGGVPSFGTPIYLASSLQYNPFGSGPGPAGIQAVDIDGDGILDLIDANAWYGTVGILYGAGGGKFYDPVEYSVAGGPWRLVAADINNDGAQEVMVSNSVFNGITVLLNANSYVVRADLTAQTVTAGATASFTLTITPSNHYNGTITFACGGLPDKSSCTFNPPSPVMDGHTPLTVQWSITTTATTTTTANSHLNTSIMRATSLGGMGLVGTLVVGCLQKPRRLLRIILGIALVVVMIFLLACGGSNNVTKTITNPGTPAGTYTVTLTTTGTAGSFGGDTSGHVMTVSLTVQ
jgi:hypothetical protein